MMRYAINSISAGDIKAPSEVLSLGQRSHGQRRDAQVGGHLRGLVDIFTVYIKYFAGGYPGKEYFNKLSVLKFVLLNFSSRIVVVEEGIEVGGTNDLN